MTRSSVPSTPQCCNVYSNIEVHLHEHTIIAKLEANLLPANVVAKELEGDFTRTIGICTKSFRHGSPAAKEFIRISRGFQGRWIK